MNCSICGKTIKDIRVTIGKTTYEVNVCADCIKPYLARAATVKEIYRRATKVKKGNSSRKGKPAKR